MSDGIVQPRQHKPLQSLFMCTLKALTLQDLNILISNRKIAGVRIITMKMLECRRHE